MFSKIISVAVALLLASPSDDAAAATKKKKKTPIENSQSYMRGTSSMMRSDSRGRVTQGRLPTPRGAARASPPATARGSTFGAGGGTVGGGTSSHAESTAPAGNQSYTALPALRPAPGDVGSPAPGGTMGGDLSASGNQPPSRTTKGPPAAKP